MSIWDSRTDYGKHALEEQNLPDDPADLASQWLTQAMDADLQDANAMALSTVTAAGYPATRIVLLRAHDEHTYRFFTNYDSNKGQELAQNAKACALFYWPTLERQIRITGECQKVSEADSDAYFASRPRGSQLGAWVSPQSEIILNRAQLLEGVEKLEAKYPEVVPRPPNWGGYVLVAKEYEFWQGQRSRLHDRIRFRLTHESDEALPTWASCRLAP